MSFTAVAGVAGLGFVTTAIVVNVIYARVRLPLPGAAMSLEAATNSFAAVGEALKRPSMFAPVAWLCITVFAAGLLSALWDGESGSGAWALVGFAGVLMQNVAFMCVEALRFGLASAASHDRSSIAGLWGFSNVLFGFNQVFLAMAMLGFTAAGVSVGFLPSWQAWLGYGGAAVLFVSAAAGPYNVEGTSRMAIIGLAGWLGWAGWIVACSVAMIRR